MHALTPYQTDIARAVLDSVLHERGLTFTVEIARGAGVGELSSQLEMLLLGLHVNQGMRLLRVCSSAEDPATGRLAAHLRQSALRGLWSVRGNVVQLGRAEVRSIFPERVWTARGPIGLLEVMAAEALDGAALGHLGRLAEASGATTVLYGTAWTGETPFESRKQANRGLEATDGIRRHFRVPWRQAAAELPGYAERVEEARLRLGEAHPEFQARYELRPVPAFGPLLPEEQLRGLDGDHARLHAPVPGMATVASIAVTRLPSPASPGATAVVTIADRAPKALRVIEHRWLEAVSAAALTDGIAQVVGETWHCGHAVADVPSATTAAADQLRHLLDRALGRSVLTWVPHGQTDDSARTLELIAAAHTGRLRLYHADGSPEYRVLHHELGTAVAAFGPNGAVSVEHALPAEGFLHGLLLLAGELKHDAAGTPLAAPEPEAALAS